MSTPTPTGEQTKIRDAFLAELSVTIVAAAGSGKTTSLRMLAEAAGRRRGLYLAYNRAIANDAANSFPSGTLCATAHSIAYRAYGHKYRARLHGPRVPATQAARILKINDALRVSSEGMIQPNQIARLALKTVSNFCHSADTQVLLKHVPHIPGFDTPSERSVIQDAIHPYACRAWDDLVRLDGQLKFDHDVYLKIWSLSSPQLPYDFILFDEAQDANPAVLAVILAQQSAQIVAVGDPCQAIYGWRGAIDAMDKFPTDIRLHLSKSFRFGPAVAAEANKWLTILGAELRVTGFEQLNSVVVDGDLTAPDAVLCRTNAKAVEQVMTELAAGRRVALVGGGDEMLRMAEAAIDLKAGIGTQHPELFAFRTWGEVQDHAENDPDAVVSTAHKAKGREWKRVLVASDFREPKPNDDGSNGEVAREDAMLAYVTVTRAQLVLGRQGLAWIDKYLPSPIPA
jgi:superfamily I DNA/RNA helicase